MNAPWYNAWSSGANIPAAFFPALLHQMYDTDLKYARAGSIDLEGDKILEEGVLEDHWTLDDDPRWAKHPP